MKLSVIVILVMSILSPILLAEDFKVAKFDVRKIFNEWQYSVESQKKIEDKRAELEEENNVRLATINSLQMQRTKMHQEYQKNKAGMSDEDKLEMDRKFRSLGRDAMALERDRRDFFQKGRSNLASEITSEANMILDQISEEAQVYALEKKFAMVVESAGETTSNTPFFLHLEGAVDITEELIKRLNDKKE
ncbi:MAG: OmpH family outer membrane protein [Akkermansiaceae bacterium]